MASAVAAQPVPNEDRGPCAHYPYEFVNGGLGEEGGQFLHAAAVGCVSCLKAIYANHPEALNARTTEGLTALDLAKSANRDKATALASEWHKCWAQSVFTYTHITHILNTL